MCAKEWCLLRLQRQAWNLLVYSYFWCQCHWFGQLPLWYIQGTNCRLFGKGCHWPRALAVLLYWWSGFLSWNLAMFSPQMGMNPLSETLHMYHMHLAGILLRVDLEPALYLVDLFWHCVRLPRSPPNVNYTLMGDSDISYVRAMCMALFRVKSFPWLTNFSHILSEFVPKNNLLGSLKEHSLPRSFTLLTNYPTVSNSVCTLLWNL